MAKAAQKITFPGAHGADLAARLDLPPGQVRAFVLFAHCFTCSKDSLAASCVSAQLAARGFAVLRFDFTGLGGSDGEFGNTGFSANLADIRAAAAFLAEHYEAPGLLVGHSLGGAAVLAVAGDMPGVKAVVSISAPAEPAHALHHLDDGVEKVRIEGSAGVTIGGRPFTVSREFVEDMEKATLLDCVAHLKKPLLVLHGPRDEIVGIDNATRIFVAAKHPKSFVSLDDADHLLNNSADALYAAEVIAAWALRYVGSAQGVEEAAAAASEGDEHDAISTETGQGKFQQVVRVGSHGIFADEPLDMGGLNSGPSPYELLSAGLAACTSMTIRLYAEFKKLPLEKVEVAVSHAGKHALDCPDCAERGQEKKIDHFVRHVTLTGDLTAEQREAMLRIANKCPVHKSLEEGAHIETRLDD